MSGICEIQCEIFYNAMPWGRLGMEIKRVIAPLLYVCGRANVGKKSVFAGQKIWKSKTTGGRVDDGGPERPEKVIIFDHQTTVSYAHGISSDGKHVNNLTSRARRRARVHSYGKSRLSGTIAR